MKTLTLFAVVLLSALSLVAGNRVADGTLSVTGTIVGSWRLEAATPSGVAEEAGTQDVEVRVRVNGDTPVTLFAEVANIPDSTGCELYITGATVLSGNPALHWKTRTNYVLTSTEPTDVYIGCRPL